MTENMQKMLEIAKNDAEVSERLKKCTDTAEIVELAKTRGIHLTMQDFRTMQDNGELSDDELENVAGGNVIRRMLHILDKAKSIMR